METNKENGFIGYEYMEVAADRQMEAVYADSYPSFGWRLDACTPCVQGAHPRDHEIQAGSQNSQQG